MRTSRHGTRPRALAAIGVGLALLVALQQLVSSGAMAVNFTTTDHEFRIYSNYVQGVSGAGFVDANQSITPGSATGVAEFGFKTARLAGLCAIAEEDLPGVGHVSIVLTAGVTVKGDFGDHATLDDLDGAGNPITLDADGLLTGRSLTESIAVSDLFLNSDALAGYGNRIRGLDLGQSADAVPAEADLNFPTDDGGSAPTPGGFGLSADNLNIANLDGGTFGVNLKGSITLPHLRLQVLPGTKTQADCPTEATS